MKKIEGGSELDKILEDRTFLETLFLLFHLGQNCVEVLEAHEVGMESLDYEVVFRDVRVVEEVRVIELGDLRELEKLVLNIHSSLGHNVDCGEVEYLLNELGSCFFVLEQVASIDFALDLVSQDLEGTCLVDFIEGVLIHDRGAECVFIFFGVIEGGEPEFVLRLEVSA